MHIEHNRSKIKALLPKIIGKNLSGANLVIKSNKIVYVELWHNCSSHAWA